MSYARFDIDSDIYAWTGGSKHTVMVPGDMLYNGKQEFNFDTIEEMREFIQELEQNGYQVPDGTYESIQKCINNNWV